MNMVYSILIDIGVLAFFGVLFYLFQRRRILRNSAYEIKDGIQKLTFDLHHFLDDKKNESFYNELNEYALKLEGLLDSMNIHEQRDQLQAPKSLPSELKEQLDKVISLF